jgi:heavy metal translocating P-type ATPase
MHIRIALSLLFAMGVMTFSLVSYADFLDPAALDDVTYRAFSQLFSYLAFLSTLPVVYLLGAPLVRRLYDLQLGHSIWLEGLVLLGVTAALAVSSINLVRGTGHTYFETVVFTLLLWSVGRYLEARVRTHAMLTLKEAQADSPTVLRVQLSDSGESTCEAKLEEVHAGEILRIPAGGRIPVDGRVVKGRSWVDASVTTGESMPLSVAKGDAVTAGAVALDATLDVVVEADYRQSGLHRLRRDVWSALHERGQLAVVAERASRWLVLFTVLLGLATFAFWLGREGWAKATLTALSVFLVACPCSLGIAVPLVVYFALGRAREKGALFRSGEALERAARIDRILLDRTGTLTQLAPRFAGALWSRAAEAKREAIWATVVSAMRQSGHPFARAVAQSTEARQVQGASLDSCRTVPGQGLEVTSPEMSDLLRVGTRRYLEAEGVRIPDEFADAPADLAHSLVAVGSTAVCRLSFEEQPYPLSAADLDALKPYAPEVLTGGFGSGAAAVWPEHTRLSPAQKQEFVRRQRQEGHRVAMVGDGLNDAVALGQSDLSVAPAGAQAINLASADLRLATPGLGGLVAALRLARHARALMKGNIGWSVAYNSVGLALAASGRLHPLAAAIAMLVSSLVVLGNSRRWHVS